jgi:voltage-gated potassium channel
MTAPPASRFPNRFLIAVIVFLNLILVGTSGYHWLEGMSWINAVYMTVITLSTVGFGEVGELSEAGRLFTIALIIGGGGLAAFSVTVGVDFILSGEWRIYWEKRRGLRMVSELSNHVIVCGFGRVGKHVTEELKAEGVHFVVVDNDNEQVTQAKELGHLAVLGNAANEGLLRQVGVGTARGLVAAANSDAENVFITLTARALQPNLYIVARVNYEDSEPKLLRAGADRTILPYYTSGRRIATMLMRPSVADFLDEVVHAGGLELFLEEVELQTGSPLVGKSISEAQVRAETGVTVLACRTGSGEFDTRLGPDTLLQPGGVLIVLGTREQLQEIMKYARGE